MSVRDMSSKMKIDKKYLELARKQFCLDISMDWAEYQANPNQMCYITKTVYGENSNFPAAAGARCYEGKDSFFKAVMCMGQLFLSVDEQIYDWAVETFQNYAPEWFCEYSNLRRIDEKLMEYGRCIADTHVYYLPKAQESKEDVLEDIPLIGGIEGSKDGYVVAKRRSQIPTIWYEQDEILRFQEANRFKSAICFSKTQPDMLAVAAWNSRAHFEAREMAILQGSNKTFDQSKLSGMAGVSADGEYLWQIGINVDKEHQGKGLAAELVSMLKEEIIRRGKVPFYGTSESHTVSQTVALKAGFVPAWTEIYVKKLDSAVIEK